MILRHLLKFNSLNAKGALLENLKEFKSSGKCCGICCAVPPMVTREEIDCMIATAKNANKMEYIKERIAYTSECPFADADAGEFKGCIAGAVMPRWCIKVINPGHPLAGECIRKHNRKEFLSYETEWEKFSAGKEFFDLREVLRAMF